MVDSTSLRARVAGLKPLNDNSQNGTIYEDADYPHSRVIKASKTPTGAREMKQEITMQSKLTGIAPTVYEKDIQTSGMTLYSMDRLKPLSEWKETMLPDVMHLVRELLVKHHMVHNDLHQENVMQTQDGAIRLIDFGDSQVVNIDGLTDDATTLLIVAQLALLLEKCNKNNLTCPDICRETKCIRGNPFMNTLASKLEALLKNTNVPLRVSSSWASYVEQRFKKLDPYLKLQVWMGITTLRRVKGCYYDTDDDVCVTKDVDWIYHVRTMKPSDAQNEWQRLLKGQGP